jgi:hypothetical protein
VVLQRLDGKTGSNSVCKSEAALEFESCGIYALTQLLLLRRRTAEWELLRESIKPRPVATGYFRELVPSGQQFVRLGARPHDMKIRA